MFRSNPFIFQSALALFLCLCAWIKSERDSVGASEQKSSGFKAVFWSHLFELQTSPLLVLDKKRHRINTTGLRAHLKPRFTHLLNPDGIMYQSSTSQAEMRH